MTDDEITDLEKTILSDIEARTNLFFCNLDSISTLEKDIANRVLPVLLPWAEKPLPANFRRAIYAHFNPPWPILT